MWLPEEIPTLVNSKYGGFASSTSVTVINDLDGNNLIILSTPFDAVNFST